MARKSLARTQAAEKSELAKELTLTCPILEMGRLASSETVHSINTICLHDECQWWSARGQNCVVVEIPGVLEQIKDITHFMLRPAGSPPVTKNQTRGGER